MRQCRARTLTIIRRDYIIIIHKIMGRQSSINIIMHNTQGGNWGREVGEEGQERPEEIMTLGNVGPRGRRGIKPRTCNNRGVCGGTI